MKKTKKAVSMGYPDEAIPEWLHVCLIYDSEEQRQKVVSEYMAAGLKQGELVRYITDTTKPEDIHSWFLEMDIDITKAIENNSFSIANAESFYCPDGQFDPQKMINNMLPRYEAVRKAGYSGIRSCGEMTWALKGLPGSDRLVEYEALLGTVGGTFPHTGICQYDSRLFDGATLFKILQVHPYMIARGQIVRNPFYMKPEEFLSKLNT